MTRALQTAFLALLIAAGLASCRRERATAAVCGQIVDRIVDVELAEQGFRDETLALRKKAEIRRVFDSEVRRCVGGKFRPGALACMMRARSTEEISHVCLR